MGCRTELQDIQTVRPANKRGLQASTVANVDMDESSGEVEVVDIVQVLEAAARLLDGGCAWARWTEAGAKGKGCRMEGEGLG
jgi:hypothetical protein